MAQPLGFYIRALFAGWARDFTLEGKLQTVSKRLLESPPKPFTVRVLDFNAERYTLRAERPATVRLWTELTLERQHEGQVRVRARLRRTAWMWLYLALAAIGVFSLVALLVYQTPNPPLSQLVMPLWTLAFVMETHSNAHAQRTLESWLRSLEVSESV